MKALIAIALLLASTSSYALVRVVEDCQTSNGQYRIVILDNEGIGRDRTPALSADVYEGDKQVASYALKAVRVGSTSFGRWHYLDQQSMGERFDLAGPSTNARNVILHAIVGANSVVVEDDNLNCHNFSR